MSAGGWERGRGNAWRRPAAFTRAAGALGLAAVLVLDGCEGSAPPAPRAVAPAARPETPSVRVTMHALHQMGGVPPGWELTLPPGDVAAGRQAFVDFGCHSCHRVEGEPFAEETDGIGPELTGMGAHHPPGYFAEAILNPDAILIEGEGYISEGGRSTMPSYPDLTITQLADLVAYITSLDTGGPHAMHHAMMGGVPAVPRNLRKRPPPPDGPARAFFVQSYEVRPDRIADFERWFREEGGPGFLAYPGLLTIETYVDVTRDGPGVTSVFGFRDQAALQRFMNDPATEEIGLEFDEFVGPHDHRGFVRRPVYPVPALSASQSLAEDDADR